MGRGVIHHAMVARQRLADKAELFRVRNAQLTHKVFTAGFDTADLKDAKALLHELNA